MTTEEATSARPNLRRRTNKPAATRAMTATIQGNGKHSTLNTSNVGSSNVRNVLSKRNGEVK